MKYKYTKLSLRAKIILDNFNDLVRAYKTAGSFDNLAEIIKTFPVSELKPCYDLGENEMKDLIIDSTNLSLVKALRAAIGGYRINGKKDCHFVPILENDVFNELVGNSKTTILQKYHEDTLWSDAEVDFVKKYYVDGKTFVDIYKHYMMHCEGGKYSIVGEEFKPVTLDAMYAKFYRLRKKNKVSSRQMNWDSEVGDLAIMLKVTERRNGIQGHLGKVHEILNKHYENDFEIKYSQLRGFFDRPETKTFVNGLEAKIDSCDI